MNTTQHLTGTSPVAEMLPLRFDAEVDRGLALIIQAPRRWAAGPYGTRRFLLRKFPFILVYREPTSDNVQVVSVAHTSRKPGYWKRRL